MIVRERGNGFYGLGREIRVGVMCRFRNIGLRETNKVKWYRERAGRDRGRYREINVVERGI